ncbi:hypothetical protein F5X98DRAFT_325933 [Xylaria grammica]|nr:hypothetical protein F5X98DRAFT_325933 [Xylaria grammica]
MVCVEQKFCKDSESELRKLPPARAKCRIARIAPNKLPFSTARLFENIYSIRQGHIPFVRESFYDSSAFAARSVSSMGTERDRDLRIARHSSL